MKPSCRRCGCAYTLHTHYRAETDCGRCGPRLCPGYAPRTTLGDLLWMARALLAVWRTRHHH